MRKKNRMKKIAAIAAASMLLCGFTGQAAEGTNQVLDQHKHDYVYAKQCTGSTPESQHGYYNNESGKYELCDIILFFYHYEGRCIICGNGYEFNTTERTHMKCGQ